MKQSFFLSLLLLLSGHWVFANTKNDVDKLFDIGLNEVNLPPDSTIAIGNSMLAMSQNLDYIRGIIRARVIKGIGYLFSNQMDSSSTELLTAIQLAEDSNAEKTFEYGLAKNFLGSVFTRLSSLDKARQNFEEALEIFKDVNNNSYICAATTNIGTIFGMQGSYPEALDFFLAAHKIASNENVPVRRQAEAMSNIATTLSLMGKKEQALQYAFKALAIDEEEKLMRGVYISHNLIANIYNRNDDYDSALYYYDLNVKIAPANNPRFTPIIARAITGTCNIYIRQNKLHEAIKLLKRVENEGYNYQTEILYNTIASNYLKLKLYDSTLFYARKALSIATVANAKKGIKNASNHLQLAHFGKKAFDSAYFYQQLHHIYKDSMYNESNERKFNNSVMALVTMEKQQEIDQLRQKRVIDKLQSRITTGSLITGILFVLAIFMFYRHEQRLKQKTLEKKLDLNQKNLTNHTLNMVHKNNGFMQMEKEVRSMREKDEVNFQKLLNIINLNRSAEKDWDNFNNYFSAAHPGFEQQFARRFPGLSIGDRRLASLIKMKLSNREIASILNIESKSVRMNKYRLKRKLELSEEIDLHDYLSEIS
ncbi:tetratricopeptide repeat protein [Fulvivirgaceae bacterium BMA12]|uniref:Tetratricopeptide repeat protein n=1 Tax=Agaribacillus aureus TaxID=3051825 RepID=A0ABT8L188_9BACT|nr:tetratricopeptide repeat protein [Fulvivirgaceae bacterium BMA12]